MTQNPLDAFEAHCHEHSVSYWRGLDGSLLGDFEGIGGVVYSFCIGWLEELSSYRLSIAPHDNFSIDANQVASMPYINDFLWLGQLCRQADNKTVYYRHTSPSLGGGLGKKSASRTLETAFDESEKAFTALKHCRRQGSLAVEAAFLTPQGNS